MTFSRDVNFFGTNKALVFFKYIDRESIQGDYGIDSVYWHIDTERRNIDYTEYLRANKDFDDYVHPIQRPTEAFSVEELFHIYDTKGESGPQLTFPVTTLETSQEFTVEFWIYFDKLVPGNYSIVGTTDRAWDQGFSVGGVMTTTTVSASCILYTELSPDMKAPCYVATTLCMTLTSYMAWHHFSFARRLDLMTGLVFAQIIMENVV